MTHKKTGEPRFTFYCNLTKMFWSTKLNEAVKSFQDATIWKEVTSKPVTHWILENQEDGKTWSEAIKERYNIPNSFKKTMVSVEYKISHL